MTLKEEKAHMKARAVVEKKFGPDWVGEEAHELYACELAKALKPPKKKPAAEKK